MLTWKFYINDTQVEEPIGWDAVEFNLHRSDQYIGLENIYSGSLLFDKTGGELLKSIYDTDGIDGVAVIRIESYCNGTTLQDTILSILNFISYSEINGEVTIQIEPSAFKRTITNRFGVSVDLRGSKDVDGNEIGAIPLRTITSHSKEIVATSRLDQNPDLLSVDSEDNFFAPATPTPITVYFPLMIGSSELADPIEVDDFFHINELAGAVSPIFEQASGSPAPITFEYKLKGIFYDAIADSRTYAVAIALSHGADGSENTVFLLAPIFIGDTGGVIATPFDISGSVDLPLSAGDKIFCRLVISNYSTGAITPVPATFLLESDAANFMKFTQSTKETPSEIEGSLICEAFSRICHAISGVADCFRSDFFGGVDSYPHLYTANGCGRYFMTTNGKAIRKMLDSALSPYPIVMSFNELFDACNAIWSLGMRIENRFGKEFIVVEPKSYFFDLTSQFQFTNVSNIRRSPAKELIYNKFSIGYEKWNLNITGTNGIDEINTSHEYALPVKNANQALSMISKFSTSGYLIEQTRRLQYQSTPTNDFETDDINFIISLNKDTITSDLYSEDEVSQDYEAGTVTERDENFTDIANIISPSTVINLRLSPVKMAMNWWPYICSSFAKQVDAGARLRFVSGQGNVLETDILVDSECAKTLFAVAQNQDLSKFGLLGAINNSPLFLPTYLEFEYPFSYSDFELLVKNSINSIDISCENGNFTKGFIKEVKFIPNQAGGIAQFKLLESSCTEGGFDDGFDDGFDNNDCD